MAQFRKWTVAPKNFSNISIVFLGDSITTEKKSSLIVFFLKAYPKRGKITVSKDWLAWCCWCVSVGEMLVSHVGNCGFILQYHIQKIIKLKTLWWHASVISEFQRWSQEDLGIKVISYIVCCGLACATTKPIFKKKTNDLLLYEKIFAI